MRRIVENAWLLLPQLGVRYYNKLCSELKGRSFLGRTLLLTPSGDGTYLPSSRRLANEASVTANVAGSNT
jgi:hypothetical protein